jgi:hypothetical protein
MPLDYHARCFLESLAASGLPRGRYDNVEQRRAGLIGLADRADPPGLEAVGGARDHLMPVHDGHVSLRVYSPLGPPARTLPACCSSMAAAGWRVTWRPMTAFAAA